MPSILGRSWLRRLACVVRRPVVQVDACDHAAVNVRQVPQWADGSGCRAAVSLDLIQRIPLGVGPGEEDPVANVKASGRRPVLDLVQHEAIRLAPGCDIGFSAVEPNMHKHVPRVVQVFGEESGKDRFAVVPAGAGTTSMRLQAGLDVPLVTGPHPESASTVPEPRLISRRCQQCAGLSVVSSSVMVAPLRQRPSPGVRQRSRTFHVRIAPDDSTERPTRFPLSHAELHRCDSRTAAKGFGMVAVVGLEQSVRGVFAN